MKILIQACIASSFLIAGCGENKTMKYLEKMADTMCACPDMECVRTVRKQLQEMATTGRKGRGSAPNKDELNRIEEAGKKIAKCEEVLMKKDK